MNGRRKPCRVSQFLVAFLALAVVFCAALPAQGAEDATFVTVEQAGAKIWQGGGTIGLKAHGSNPLRLKVVNKLNAEHGFTIDTMKVKDVLKPGEQKTIVVPRENIDMTVGTQRVYCRWILQTGDAPRSSGRPE
jgi:hypothetical protein